MDFITIENFSLSKDTFKIGKRQAIDRQAEDVLIHKPDKFQSIYRTLKIQWEVTTKWKMGNRIKHEHHKRRSTNGQQAKEKCSTASLISECHLDHSEKSLHTHWNG